ncbi:MAG: NADH-quinone oxidoreductase subunit NuoF [Gemmataceae bacterium]
MAAYEPVLLGADQQAELGLHRHLPGRRRLPDVRAGAARDAAGPGGGGGEGVRPAWPRRGGLPTGLKWTFLPKDHPGPIYLCINADESEPCTFNNRVLMELDPHQVIEGIMIAAFATKATTAYYYIRYEYGPGYRATQKAIDECYAAGLLGQNVLGTGFNLNVYTHRGAGAYICGEETGLIESLEGKRAWPRIKPPFPAVEGAFRKPTVVNNVETMACVRHVLDRGVDWFKGIGVPPDPANPRDAGSYGPKLFNLAGHVNKPGTYDVPLGIPLGKFIDDYGGGCWKGRKVKAVNPGGLSMGYVTGDELDMVLDFNGPAKKQCLGLGTGAITVIDDQTSMVDVLWNTTRFFSHESCGQCTPCREGTAWMFKIADRIRRGQGRLEDLDILVEVADRIGIMPGTTICGLADGAGWPVKTAIRKFRPEFEAYIKAGTKRKPLTMAGAH